MAMPKKLQPGPLAGEISYFAPVSLFFFFFLIFIITTLRGIDLHPMNYFFLAAAFFAFHLLLAYLVDHVFRRPAQEGSHQPDPKGTSVPPTRAALLDTLESDCQSRVMASTTLPKLSKSTADRGLSWLRSPSLLSFIEPPRIRNPFMKVSSTKGIFSKPSEPGWALLFRGGKIHGEQGACRGRSEPQEK
jgi:hypothetical protein